MESTYYDCIVSIRNKLTDEQVPLNTCSIQKITSMYSNTKQPIYKLVISDKPISRNNSYVILYRCHTCNSHQEITLNLFMRKVANQSKRCSMCKNLDETKCEAQSKFMKENMSSIIAGNYIKQVEKVKSNSLDKHLEKSISDWETEEEEFKERYFLYHLTSDDFLRISSKIISVGNDKIISLDNWSYYPTYRIYNQTRYTPMLINKLNNTVEKPNYIKFRCENCECEYTHRDLEVVKNYFKMLCQTCTLTNKSFSLRKMILKNGQSILWQSIPEKHFIEWCEKNNIPVQNGPKIAYEFQNKQHIYRVDFELPNHKQLIEIKDNHCWHQDQVKSGKFGAKENAAKEWCIVNSYTYHILFPKTIQEYKNSMLKSL